MTAIEKVYALMGRYDYEGGATLALYTSRESAHREAQRRTAHKANEPNWTEFDDDYETYHVEERGLLP